MDVAVRIGRVIKTFTSTTLLQLAGEGKLSFEDPVGKYAPQVPSGKTITVRMLLDHTSGIFSCTEDRASSRRSRSTRSPGSRPTSSSGSASRARHTSPPGKRSAYILAGRC
jgi:CubicO group peptidase (beta-lactamase class C family)